MGITIKLDRDYIINGCRYYLSQCFLGASLISYSSYTPEEARRIVEEVIGTIRFSEVRLRSVEGVPEFCVIEIRGVELKEVQKWQV